MSDPLSSGDLHVCIDRYAPMSPTPPMQGDRLAALTAKLWPAHQRVLRVRFLGGDPRIHQRIAQTAQRWSDHAAIRFRFDNAPDAPIRIAFAPGGSWSYIGTDLLDPLIGPDEPTMNFGWLSPATPNDELQRVVLHEFGHALGLVHEHQSPAATIPWNRAAVYAYFAGPPNYWTAAQVDQNIFARYAHDQINASRFDPASIMLYPIPPQFTDGKLVIDWNRDLSLIDRAHIGQIYPFDGHA
jgi:hypothetical protein